MAADVKIIPRPASVERLPGSFDLAAAGTVEVEPGFSAAGELLMSTLAGWGADARLAERGKIALRRSARPLPDEGYELLVNPAGVTVWAATDVAAIHAVQTLRQLPQAHTWRNGYAGAVPVPCVRIADQPRLRWRGAMLDVGRRFLPTEDLLRFVDQIALHKLNVLHLHLTEDAGWRVEIEQHPRLHEIGSRRSGTVIGRNGDGAPTDGIPHAGFYTKADLRRVVNHAAALGITVVPEIDVPGHAQAAIAAYPQLGNLGRPLPVATGWGISEHVLNVDESTVRFFEDVLDEVVDVFPGEYVHLGGDECPVTEWQASPAAQARIRELGLPGANALTGWFVGQLSAFLQKRQRKVIGWDELIDAGPPEDATVMAWQSVDRGVRAARLGHDVIMTPRHSTYFDYYQSADTAREPLAIGELLTLRQAYEFTPVPPELDEHDAARVLGAQLQIWCEYIDGAPAIEYMAFPRACAFAEVAWSQSGGSGSGSGDYPAFRRRLETHLERLHHAGVNYRRLDAS